MALGRGEDAGTCTRGRYVLGGDRRIRFEYEKQTGRGRGRWDCLRGRGWGGVKWRRCDRGELKRREGFALRLHWNGGQVMRMSCGPAY